MFRKIIIAVALGFLSGLVISAIADDEKSPPPVMKVTMAIFDFKIAADTEKTIYKSGRGQWSREVQKESSVLTDKFITAIVRTNKIKVVERDKLETVMKEFSLTQSGMTAPKHSQEIGKLLGADYLLHGSISMFDANVKYTAIPYTDSFNKIMEAQMAVDIRIVETETGKIVSAETANEKVQKKELVSQKGWREEVPKAIIEELQRKIVNSLVTDVVDAIYPIKVASVKNDILYLNRGEKGGIKQGDKLLVMVMGDEIRDPDTNSVIGFEDTVIATVEVTEVMAKLSKAKVLEWRVKEKEIPKGAICRRIKEKKESKSSDRSSPPKKKYRLPGSEE